MRPVLIDTDVVSFLFKRDTRATLYEADLDGALHLISFMTFAELCRWPLSNAWGERKTQELEEYLTRYTLVWPNAEMCKVWAKVSEDFNIQTADAWIAATALYYQVPVITHNRSHFSVVQGLTVLSHG